MRISKLVSKIPMLSIVCAIGFVSDKIKHIEISIVEQSQFIEGKHMCESIHT